MAGRKPTQRIDELEDEIKHRDRRIEELRCEIDELRDLVRRMEEDVEDGINVIDGWAETFDMVQTESGGWTWKPFWDEWNALIAPQRPRAALEQVRAHHQRSQAAGRPPARRERRAGRDGAAAAESGPLAAVDRGGDVALVRHGAHRRRQDGRQRPHQPPRDYPWGYCYLTDSTRLLFSCRVRVALPQAPYPRLAGCRRAADRHRDLAQYPHDAPTMRPARPLARAPRIDDAGRHIRTMNDETPAKLAL
jgi:hypothetical protein